MNIQILSDLHIEFHRDYGRSFIESLSPHGIDVLVVAGDLGVAKPKFGPPRQLNDALEALCDIYPNVIYVVGNHEYYYSSLMEVNGTLSFLSDRISNLHWLNNSSVTIGEVRFAGSPLWPSPGPLDTLYSNLVNDYLLIKGFSEWVSEQNRIAVNFLSTSGADVVVTHYLPSPKSIHERFKNDKLNGFFLCDMERYIGEQELWIHGHTHESMDYHLGNTRVICNPLGYVGVDLNSNFIEKFIVSV
jgi:Icc-related predicted phosphoesterase